MEPRISSRITYSLAGAIVLCLAGLAYQYVQIRSLRLEVSESRAAVEQAANDAATMLTALERQEARIESLEKAPNPVSGLLKLPSPDQLHALKPGIHVLETNTPYDPDAEKASSYEITHVVLDIQYEDYGTRLHLGFANSGLIPKGVYFDYDNDGRIDTNMAMDFVRDIPVVGRRLAKAYDADLAQNLYSILVSEAEDAKYTSLDELSNDAEAASSIVWKFLMDNFDAIKAWVLESMKEQQSDA